MSTTDIVRVAFDAYLGQDREVAERLLSEDFVLCQPARRPHQQGGGFILYEYELKTGERRS